MQKKILLLLLLLPAMILFAKHKDIVYMMDGSEFLGELEKIDGNTIVLITSEGSKTFHKDSVRAIDLGTWRPGDDWETKRDIDDPILLEALEATGMRSGIRTKYPTAGHITVYRELSVNIEKDLTANQTYRNIVYITNERGKNQANYVARYKEDIQDVSIDFARAVGRDRKISTIRDNAIEDGSPYNSLSEYQRIRRKKFAMTGAEVGSIIDYQVTKTTDAFNDFCYPSWSMNFYSTEPILKSIFEIRYHKDLEPIVTAIEMPIKAKKSKDGDYRILRYEMTDIQPYVKETMMPRLNKILPNVTVSFPQDHATISANFYTKYQEAYDADEEIKAIIAEKIGQDPSCEQIYNYVSENYSDNGIGMSEYYPYPKPLSKLLDMAQTSNYEKVYILWAFYKAAGKNPEMILYGPSLDTDLPTEAFNVNNFTSINVKIEDNGSHYLYPNEYVPYKHQSPPSGRYVLPVKAAGAELEEFDMLAGDYTWQKPVYHGKLNADGSLHLEYSREYNGPTGANRYRRYKYSKPQEIDNSFQELAKDIDPMANLVDFNLDGYKSLEDDVKISYSVDIPAYAVGAGDEILAFKLPTVTASAYDVGAQERILPFSKEGNSYGEKEIIFDLPEGYEIEFLPKSIDVAIDYRSFKGELKVEDGKIIYQQTTTGQHEPILDPDEYPDYKEYVENISRFADNWILIRKK